MSHSPTRRRFFSGALSAAGIVLLLAAAAGVAYPLWWNHRSATAGERLVTNASLPSPVRRGAVAADCVKQPLSGTASVAAGVVAIASLHMTAPVLQGLSDNVLAVAAGHDPASPWPGALGESVLESHDVSYFSEIDTLRHGAVVSWIDDCRELTFTVTGYEVLEPGAPIEPPPNGRGLALITCYPTDALFYTPERFVLLTSLDSTIAVRATSRISDVTAKVGVPAPAGLRAEGLELQGSGVLVGYLHVTGSPSAGFRQGPASLDLEAVALESYIGAEKVIAQQRASWWRDLAVPGLAMPASSWSNSLDTNVTEHIRGNSVVSVTLSSANVSFELVAVHGELLVQSVHVP